MKFLHDRHNHGISNLYDDDLAEFQVEYLGFHCRFTLEKVVALGLLYSVS